MINEAFAKGLEADLKADFPDAKAPLAVGKIGANGDGKEVTLSEQWEMKERIEAELRARARRERLALVAEYDRQVTAIESDYAARAEEAVADLAARKRLALRRLADDTARKLREHELLATRMG